MNDRNINEHDYVVYILECSDGSLYTGITNHLDKRLHTHALGSASKYTKSRLPVKCVYTEFGHSKSSALRREYAIKQLGRSKKLELIDKNINI